MLFRGTTIAVRTTWMDHDEPPSATETALSAVVADCQVSTSLFAEPAGAAVTMVTILALYRTDADDPEDGAVGPVDALRR
ncbi:hypothetical protein GCM10028790_39680 [Micromonospora taraxaci]